MIKLEVVENNHFVVSANQPMRIEVSKTRKCIIAHIYRGIAINLNQRPCAMYDGSNPEQEDIILKK